MQIEYIRREDMLNAVEKLDIIPSVDGMGNPTNAEDFRVQFLGTVLKVEPADVVPLRHARWRHYEGMYACEACGAQLDDESPFCPMCGAKMDAHGPLCVRLQTRRPHDKNHQSRI